MPHSFTYLISDVSLFEVFLGTIPAKCDRSQMLRQEVCHPLLVALSLFAVVHSVASMRGLAYGANGGLVNYVDVSDGGVVTNRTVLFEKTGSLNTYQGFPTAWSAEAKVFVVGFVWLQNLSFSRNFNT